MGRDEEEVAAVWVDTTTLVPWSGNPRRNDRAVDEVASSIRRFGFGAPLVARKANRELIAGHTRLLAALKLQLPRVPVRFLDIDPVQAHLLALADNRTGEIADWDDDKLAAALREARDADERLLGGTGFTDADLRRLLEPDTAGTQETEEPKIEATEALRERWGVEAGQLWAIDTSSPRRTHRLLVGDCRRAEDVARLVDGRRIAVAFTSPPYAAQRDYDAASGFEPVPPEAYVDWFDDVQASVRRHLADDGSWFVNIRAHAEDGQRSLYVFDLVIAHVRRWRWLFVDDLAWLRAGVPGAWPNRFKNGWEPVFHFAAQAAIKFRPEAVSHKTRHAFDYSPDNSKSVSGSGLLGKEHASGFRDGMARPSNVIEAGSGGARVTGLHPAEFPVALPRWFFEAYSDHGDAVMDPFGGSGASLVAAEESGRVGYALELSPRYAAVTLERLRLMGLRPRLP